jgi:hypothetical protein
LIESYKLIDEIEVEIKNLNENDNNNSNEFIAVDEFLKIMIIETPNTPRAK